jgi:hypothetical protein
MALAAFKASSISPSSRICRVRWAWCAQTPAKQSVYLHSTLKNKFSEKNKTPAFREKSMRDVYLLDLMWIY